MKILYFASLRTAIGRAEEDFDPPPEIRTLGALVPWLQSRSPAHKKALADLSLVRMAVNQDYAGLDHPVGPNDEVAFFPPVTGGGPWGGSL